ncbi:MAG: T9SS type A sorting domain-containing protein [candidate division Zixibacteria bacterium]|nr:T9SS type A sorting domain-containing protein [Candidatus Tariuqbacter arcticus]
MKKFTLFCVITLFLIGICWADQWQTRAPMPTARGYVPSVELEGKIYVIGGDVSGGGSFSGVNEVYDPATNTWVTKAPMPTARCLHCLAAVNGKIYAIGGYANGVLNINQEYNPVTDTWTTKAPMPNSRSGAGWAVVDDKIYVIGGHPGYGFVNYNQMYDPAANTWTTKAPLPTARAYLGAAEVDGKIYAIGGIGGPIPGWYNMNVNEEYDPATNTWTTKATMPSARHNILVAALNNKVYAIGGWTSGPGNVLNLNQEYDPVSDSWVTKAPMFTARTAGGAATEDKIYVMGGFGNIFDVPLNVNEEYSTYTQPITIMLTPHNTPIQIPSGGGSFLYDLEIANNTSVTYTIDVSSDVTLPGGTFYPIFIRNAIDLPGGAVIIRNDLTQFVPGGAIAGNYSYNGYVHDHNTWELLTEDSFPFEKLPGDGAPAHNFGWALYGWDGEEAPIIHTPAEFILHPAHPNPFNAETIISFELRAASCVKLMVYDVSGRETARLFDGWESTGIHQVVFDANSLPSGVYFARLSAGNESQTRKMLLIK